MLTAGFVASSFLPLKAADPAIDRPMEFVLVHGGGVYCRTDGTCADWIAAEGQIMADSPKKLQRFLKKSGSKALPIVVRSPGGDVASAMQMGTIIRRLGLSVAVGGTRAQECLEADPLCDGAKHKDGSVVGEIYSDGAVCLSACPLMLAGGVRRVAGPFAAIGVHQITTTYREMRVQYRTEYEMLNGKKKILSRQEIGRKMVGEHDTTDLDSKQKAGLMAYLSKMGVEPGIFDLMMSADPKSIRLLAQVEALNLKMTTELSSADQLVIAGNCPADKTIAACEAAVLPDTIPSAGPQSEPLPDQPDPGMPVAPERRAMAPAATMPLPKAA